MTIPVVYISKTLRQSPQQGDYQVLLPSIVKQAEKNNTEVFLIGDDGNKEYCPDNHRHLSEYTEGVAEFEALYLHLSTNPEDIEMFCFSRWFVLRNFLRKHNYEGALYLDNDILLFANAHSEFQKRKHLYCVLSGRTSGHSSYWTLEGITEFCDYLMEVYTEKGSYEFHRLAAHFHVRQKFGLPGGLCDMTLLEGFARYRCPHLVGECSVVSEDAWYYDHVIHESEGFEHKDGIKHFTFKNGIPFSTYLNLKKDIPFATIHFQGGNKIRIEKFCEMCNDSLISHK